MKKIKSYIRKFSRNFFIICFLVFLASRGTVYADLLGKLSWLAVQLAPGYHISFTKENAMHHGMSWDVTPLHLSFWPNPLVSPWSFLMIEPEKRFSGALDLTLRTNLFPGDEKNNFWLHQTALELYLPILGHGEKLGMKLGGSYSYMNYKHGASIDVGFFFFYSILDLAFSYHFDLDIQYSFKLGINYF